MVAFILLRPVDKGSLKYLLTLNLRRYLQVHANLKFSNHHDDQLQHAEQCNNFDPEVINTLQKRSFLQQTTTGKAGLLGQELLNNWRSEWWRCAVLGKNEMFAAKLEESYQKNDDEREICESLIKTFLESATKDQAKFPVGVAANVLMKNPATQAVTGDGSLLFAVFVERRIAELEFDNWHSSDTKWIKKYLGKPAKLVTKASETSNQDDYKKYVAVYNYKDTQFVMQETFLLGQRFLSEMKAWVEVESLFNSSPSLILIRHDLRNLLMATLADAYHTISFPNYFNRQMRIHPYLAPVKTAVYIEGEKITELKQLSTELCSIIRGMDTTCWNANEMKLTYADLDESGVVHQIVISEETLGNGLLHIRHRDSSLKIQVHISELEEKLQRYLQPT